MEEAGRLRTSRSQASFQLAYRDTQSSVGRFESTGPVLETIRKSKQSLLFSLHQIESKRSVKYMIVTPAAMPTNAVFGDLEILKSSTTT
jgi:hypothetical protein